MESLYYLELINDEEIQITRKYPNYNNTICKSGKNHSFSSGECIYCGIVGCSVGLRDHVFLRGKCIYCGIRK